MEPSTFFCNRMRTNLRSTYKTQEHSYLIERCTPYGMIASTNVFFLTMLDPYDHGILLVDGPYWRKEFLERNTDEREQWSKESSDLMDRKPSLTSQDEPWVLMRKDFLRMQKAGYGGPSTFADLLEYAFHTLLVRMSFVLSEVLV